MAWLRQLLDWQRETADPGEFLDSLRFDLSANEVFVFTPKGDVIALPVGRDAGRLRLRRAHRGRPPTASAPGSTAGWCRWSARWTTATSSRSSPPRRRRPGPRRDWLGFVKRPAPATRSARWFSKERREEAIEQGKDAIARAMRKQGLPLQRLLVRRLAGHPIAHDLRYADISALYAAIGEGHVSAQSVVQRLVAGPRRRGGRDRGPRRDRRRRTSDAAGAPAAPAATPASSSRASTTSGSSSRAAARRCRATRSSASSPAATASRCTAPTASTSTSLTQQPERMVEVEWAPTASSVFLVAIQVEALDRSRLLSDVTRVLSDQHVNILSASVQTTRDRVAMSRFTFEMGDPKHLGHVLKAVRGVEGVYDVYRVTSARSR